MHSNPNPTPDQSVNKTISSFELFERTNLIEEGHVLTFNTLTKQLEEIGVKKIDRSIITSPNTSPNGMLESTRQSLNEIYDDRGTWPEVE